MKQDLPKVVGVPEAMAAADAAEREAAQREFEQDAPRREPNQSADDTALEAEQRRAELEERGRLAAEAAHRRAEAVARARARVPQYFPGTLAANAVHALLERVGEYRWGERATETARLIEAALLRLLEDGEIGVPDGQEKGFEPGTGAGHDQKLTAAIDALKTTGA